MDESLTLTVHEPVEFEYVGQLYRKIRRAFETLPEKGLFIGPKPAQELEQFTRRMQILNVVDRKSAVAAIDFIVAQGEGSPKSRDDSHYGRFVALRQALAEQVEADPSFAPARNVVSNPRTRSHPDAPIGGTMITNPDTVSVVEFFNDSYEAALLLLAQMYSYGGETLGERTAIRDAARQIMTLVIRPAAELITELPVGMSSEGPLAGPSFELYSPFQLSTQAANRWTIIDERLALLRESAGEFAGKQPRFAFMAENIGIVAGNLRAARDAEASLTVSEMN
jgi:hypothetical protein